MEYVEATEARFAEWLALVMKLFPEEPRMDMEKVCRDILASSEQEAFLCDDGGSAVGFVHVSLRKDYVEGTESSPVGYLEALYVEPPFRQRGIARELTRLAEAWAAGKGCTEMGSDAHADNLTSHAFHTKVGYKEAARLVAFTKKIDS